MPLKFIGKHLFYSFTLSIIKNHISAPFEGVTNRKCYYAVISDAPLLKMIQQSGAFTCVDPKKLEDIGLSCLPIAFINLL